MNDRQQVRDMSRLLKDMEPYVKDPHFLRSGRRFTNFNLLPREVWANWLFCAVLQKQRKTKITFAEDDIGDGLIVDTATGQYVRTEHVAALDRPVGEQLPIGDARIIGAVEHKIARGPEYASGKALLVFTEGAGEWHRDKVRDAINGRHHFLAVYCISLESPGPSGYAYTLTQFDPRTPHTSISFKVKIDEDFSEWRVFLLLDRANGIVEMAL